MDALFSLPRKKAAGVSHWEHGALFFGYQMAVDEHIASYKTSGKNSVKVSCQVKILLCNLLS